MFAKYRLIALMAAMVAIFALVACSSAAPVPTPQIIEREVVVEKEVPVEVVQEKVVEVVKEVEVPVETEIVVEKEVEKIVEVEVMAPEGPKETIIFGDLNWSSALLQNRIAQFIVEHGYGYPTDVKFGRYLASVPRPQARRHARNDGNLASQPGRSMGRGPR